MLARIQNIVTLFAKIAVGIAFAVMIAVVLIQVGGRTAGSSPVWTEELTRFALLFMVAFGVGLSIKSHDLVNVDVVCDQLPRPMPFVLRLVSAIIMVVFTILIVPEAYKFFAIGALQKSPAMGLRMDIMHASMIVFLVGLGLFATFRIIDMFQGEDHRVSDEPE